MNIKAKKINKKLTISMIALFLCISSFAGSTDVTADDSIPQYSEEQLTNRFGKKSADQILSHKIEEGFSSSMVILAKGKPYLIEEPMGKYMDFEIYYYTDCTVFIEYGVVTTIKYHTGLKTE